MTRSDVTEQFGEPAQFVDGVASNHMSIAMALWASGTSFELALTTRDGRRYEAMHYPRDGISFVTIDGLVTSMVIRERVKPDGRDVRGTRAGTPPVTGSLADTQ